MGWHHDGWGAAQCALAAKKAKSNEGYSNMARRCIQMIIPLSSSVIRLSVLDPSIEERNSLCTACSAESYQTGVG